MTSRRSSDNLTALVAADAAATARRRCWVHNYPQELQNELVEIRRRLHAGELPHATIRGVTRSLKVRLAEQGHYTPGYGTIREWLQKRD
jgi:hypothetical protein